MKVFPYLLRLAPEEFSYENADDWAKQSLEYQLVLREQKGCITEQELIDEYGDLLQDEFLYEKAKKLHLNEEYEEALNYYIQCNDKRADYQIKRILGLPFEDDKEMNVYYEFRTSRREEHSPVEEFLNLKINKKFIDETTFYGNRGYYLYFMDYIDDHVRMEIREDLGMINLENASQIYYDKALRKANTEQRKIIEYNMQMIEQEIYEELPDDLNNAILNVKNDTGGSFKTFLKYVQIENSYVAAQGIGVVLAMRGDQFCETIFKYLDDYENLKVYAESKKNDFKYYIGLLI